MFDKLSLTALAGALCLSSACVIVDSDDETTTASTASTSDSATGGTGEQTTGSSATTSTTAEQTTSGADGSTSAADSTGGAASCGWGRTGDEIVPMGYVCGGECEDPDMMFARDCPAELVVGDPCGDVTGVGCCDAEGNLWYCLEDATSQTLQMETCG